MSKEKRRVPKLRFPGFTEDWEQYRLDELLIERSILCTQSEKYPLVSFTVERGVTPKTERYNREALVVGNKASKKYKLTLMDDIVYNPANLKFGAIARNKYGKAVFSPIYVTLEVKSDRIISDFLEYILTSKSFINKALRYQQGTVYERQSVNVESFLLQTINIPTVNEQIAISNLLYKYDKIISIYKHKLVVLNLKKKALLQKLFPKQGATCPTLRFPGYTDDWEQRKFKDIAFKRGKISEADLPYVEFEDINSGIGTLNKNILQKVGHKKGILFETGDVLFGKLRPYLQNWLLCQFRGIAVGDFWVLQPQNVSSVFLYYLIQSEAYQSVANISSGTKMPRSSWSLVSETQFSISKYNEANMIGEFFSSIDKNITLHQRKLEHLQLQKKSLLQQMFV